MKDTLITEFVNFTALETTSDEQLLSKADIFINQFMKKQDGFVDAELVKNTEGMARCFILRYQSFDKVKAIIEKLRSSEEFDAFKSVIVPGSIGVTFQQQLNSWPV
ncbi:MAG: hypothetical protein HC905_02135 [Bacteroidales bacterium]|nr:hypothetical protein [Bacteroidales bacterium]